MAGVIPQEVLDTLTTKADELYTSMEDGAAYEDGQDFMDDVKDYLDYLVNVLERAGGRVRGMSYTDGREKLK
jgi:hypothetical protein